MIKFFKISDALTASETKRRKPKLRENKWQTSAGPVKMFVRRIHLLSALLGLLGHRPLECMEKVRRLIPRQAFRYRAWQYLMAERRSLLSVMRARCVIADNSGTFGKPHTMTHAQHNVNKNSADLQQNSAMFTMDIIQRRLLQNQQMMLQQQQTVSALMQKFENMSKSLSKNNQPTVSRNSARRKSPEVQVPLITSKSIYDDIDSSEPEYSSTDEHNLSNRESDNGNDDIEDASLQHRQNDGKQIRQR